MKAKFKNPFERKQKGAVMILCVLMFIIYGCGKDEQPLSDEEISFNLSKSGEFDPALLIGEWELVKFASTADGNKISKVVNVSGGRLEIPIAPTADDCEIKRGQWRLQCANEIFYICTISGNLIELKSCLRSYLGVGPPHVEYDCDLAFDNAYSFVIKGDELIIYFIKVEDKNLLSKCIAIKNKNLIIFKKR